MATHSSILARKSHGQRESALQADSLPPGSPRKLQNTGVGSLSLLQGNFPTQESNWGLQNCGRILYQLSNQGNPGTLNGCSIMAFFKCLTLVLSVEKDGLISCGSRGRLRTSGLWLPGGSFVPRVEKAAS